MKLINEYYLKSFENYAEAALRESVTIDRISTFAQMLNLKANELLRRAYLHQVTNVSRLQRELFETGKEYVHKFAFKQKELKALRVHQHRQVASFHFIIN